MLGKPLFFILLACVGGCLCLSDNSEFETSYVTAYEFVENFPNRGVREELGDVSGVAIGSNGSTYIFTRASRHWDDKTFNKKNELNDKTPLKENTIYVLDKHGSKMAAFGASHFYMPHGLYVDKAGNIYATDVGLHQVMRFPKGANRPDLVLGEKFVPGNDDKHFCKPTKVSVASNGDIFVADGYCNSRVIKFDKHGKFLGQIGKPNSGGKSLKQGEFNLVHGISLDEKRDLLCVADRENGRVQCFKAGTKDQKEFGKFVTEIRGEGTLGHVMDVAFMPNSDLMIVHINDNGFSLVSVFSSADNQLMEPFTFIPKGDPSDQGFGDAHTIAADPQGKFLIVGSLSKRCDEEEQYCFEQKRAFAVPYNVFKFAVTTQKADYSGWGYQGDGF